MIERLRRISYFFAYAVATIPLWHYIRDGRILALMVAVVTFAYVMVILSSVQVAQPILSSEKAKTVLPRWLPDKPKYHKWWMLVRRTLKWHLMLVPLKMGLALGFAQWLFISARYFGVHFFHPYFYLGYDSYGFDIGRNLNPQTETILIGLIVITLITIFDLILFNAIILLTEAKVIHSITIRLIIQFVMIGLTVLLSSAIWLLYPTDCYYCILYRDRTVSNRIIDTTQLASNVFIEQGVLLAANIMRPQSNLTYEELGFISLPWYLPDTQKDDLWDNRPFVARQIVAGILGLMLYAGVTWVILWFVDGEGFQ